MTNALTTEATAQQPSAPASDDLAAFFVEHGYVVVEKLLATEEIEALQADLIKLARGEYPCPSLQPLSDGISDTEALERILCIHQPHFVSDTIKQFTTHPKIAQVLGQVVGAHLHPSMWNSGV